MKVVCLIITMGCFTSCYSLPKIKSDNYRTDGIRISNGIKKEIIGPLKILVPQGWCFNKSQWGKKRFLLEMATECDYPLAEYFVHFTYFKEKKDKSFIELQHAKNKTKAVFSSFHLDKFKGKTVRYETDNQSVSFSAGLGENDALLIILSAPKGKLTQIEQTFKSMLH